MLLKRTPLPKTPALTNPTHKDQGERRPGCLLTRWTNAGTVLAHSLICHSPPRHGTHGIFLSTPHPRPRWCPHAPQHGPLDSSPFTLLFTPPPSLLPLPCSRPLPRPYKDTHLLPHHTHSRSTPRAPTLHAPHTIAPARPPTLALPPPARPARPSFRGRVSGLHYWQRRLPPSPRPRPRAPARAAREGRTHAGELGTGH